MGSASYVIRSRQLGGCLGGGGKLCGHRAGKTQTCALGMLRAFWLTGRGNRAGPFKKIFRCLAVLPAWAAHPVAPTGSSSSSSGDKAGGEGHGRAAGPPGGLLATAGLG